MNRAINGNRCGDHTRPDRYRTGSKNGHEAEQGELSLLAGVPKQEYPHGSADSRSAIPEGFWNEGDT
jgi:hypothetical protein